ncbi:nuclear transport factor 2 family protein [Streptomyces prunicolor]|uniref:Nuclear transport factor 2 family protein n=1 Tax=Streptomyces prunicolor TaxID=67348 RepID=A0ABU4F310_9ACTN|nr:nuclear transport factor 2 family protein [Streptomyces prunicolor]MCX5243279.1 nuclear transport factor 2 family protein [Streptomyces prunicolor]MDV7214388.1 nuclear transport factor 2 family protein [Streptomyces prunicolor]
MKLISRKSITAAAAVAVVGGLSIAAVPSQAASPAHDKASAQSGTAAPTLTARQLAELPLTDRHLTKHEKANLAIVLRDYYVAEGSHIDVPTFVNSFTKDGVFNDMVAGQAYRGKALGSVLPYMKSLFSNVHRDLKRITVNGDTVSIELSIQGTFDGQLQAPTGGVVKGNGHKVDAPTADFWYLKNGKVTTFNCFVGYSKMYSDMGVNFDWASAVNQH